MSNKLRLIGVASELGAGTRGASMGIDALQVASIKEDRDFFKGRKINRVETENYRLYADVAYSSAPHIEGIKNVFGNIEKVVGASIADEAFPVLISGDHSNAAGTIAGIHKAQPDKRIGVIWIDAHADLHSPYTSPTGNVHGMPLAIAINEDNSENKIKEPEQGAIAIWNELKGLSARVLPEDLFFVGVRDTEEQEDKLMINYQIPNITVDQYRGLGVGQVAQMALNHLEKCDLIYISFDVDSMDPMVSLGTGTPVEYGFTEDEARELLLELTQSKKLCAFEITEINPLLDRNGNSMAEAAFRIFKPVVEQIEALHIK